MTEAWRESRSFVIGVLVWLGGLLAFYLCVHLPTAAPVAALEGDGPAGAPMKSEVARFYQSGPTSGPAASLPTYETVKQAAAAERARLDKAAAAARARLLFQAGPEFTIPQAVAERALEYTKVRDRVAAKLRELANKEGVRIPAELDPRSDAKDLPADRQAAELLLRVAITDRALRAAIAAQVPRVESVSHDLAAPRGEPLARRRVTVRIEGGLDQIVAFVGRCSVPPDEKQKAGSGVLAVRAVEITGEGRGATLTADIELAALALAPAKPKPAPRRPRSSRRSRRAGPGF